MTPSSPGRPRSAGLAAFLSFVIPGLGQAYLGYWPLGVLLAAPVVLLVGFGILVVVIGVEGLRNQVFSSSFLIGVFALNAALLLWRLFAIAYAGLSAGSRDARARDAMAQAGSWTGRASLLAVGLFLAAAVGMHAYVAIVVGQLGATLEQVFDDPPRISGGSEPGDEEPDEVEELPSWDGEERINFLFIGVDEAPGRDFSLTDTILVVSVDPSDNTAVMVSVPRDTALMPLPDASIYAGGLYPRKINELSSEAAANPEVWCPRMTIESEQDAAACGLRALEESVSLYMGIPIHYYARVDLLGFEQLIDALGGVELCLPGRLIDPLYTDPRTNARGLELAAGCNRYGGEEALAYARSRQGWIEMADGSRQPQNDFLRAGRQQEILLALREELEQSNLLFELPQVIEAIGSTVSTDFPRAQAGDLATLVPLVAGPDIDRLVLGHPGFVDLPVNPDLNYILTPRREAVREAMEELFGGDAPLDGWYVGSDAEGPPF